EQGYGALLRGVRLQSAVEAAALAGGAEEREERLSEGCEEEQPIPPVDGFHASVAHAQAEARVLLVAEGLFDREASGVQVDDVARGPVLEARREVPGVLHALRVDRDDRADRILALRHPRPPHGLRVPL